MASSKPSIQSLYESYKQSTNYPLSWLWLQREPKPPESHTSFRTTSEIITAANEVCRRKVPVPASVLSTLASAIKQRKLAFESFRAIPGSSNTANASHKAFIQRLEQVFEILSPLKAKANANSAVNESPTPSLSRRANVFDNLGSDLEQTSESDQIDQTVKMSEVSAKSDGSPAASVLDDDEFGQWIELSLFIYEMDTLLQQINSYWEEAAEGLMPIALAAALSTFTLYAVDRLAQHRTKLAADATEFIDRWMSLKSSHPKIRFTDIPELTCWSGGRLDDQTKFHHIHQILRDMRTMDEYKIVLPDAGKPMKPIDTISRPLSLDEIGDTSDINQNFSLDDCAFDKMQESMRQLTRTGRAIASLEIPDNDRAVSEALLPFIRRLETDTNSPIPTCLVFGMEMLLSSFKAFMWPKNKLNKTNCRLKVLMFAQEVKKEIDATIKAMETATAGRTDVFAIHSLLLQQRSSDLDDIMKEKRFDLYYQAPWTAGSHMNEILDVARYEGSDLCFRTSYLCAVLHLYNALRAITQPIEAIPLLEKLCSAYRDILFLGSLPTDNFSSHYRRARGMSFDRDKDTGRTEYSKLSKFDTGPHKQQSMHICTYTLLHSNCYRTDNTFWTKTYLPNLSTRPTDSQKRAINDELHSTTFNVSLEKTKQLLLQDFQGDLPPARLNLFAVFRLCLKILQQSGAAIHERSDRDKDVSDCSIGFLVVDELLEQIVEHLRDDDKRKLLKYWRPTNIAKNIFKNIGLDLRFEDFLWKL